MYTWMARALRVDYPGAAQHIFGRGNGKQAIFLDDEDRDYFVRRILSIKAGLPFICFGACLMGNHYHLAVQTIECGISRIMHLLLTAYATYFNGRWARVGHTFQGRFGSRLVNGENDLRGLIRYIHMNPVEAGLAGAPDVWEWSGHQDIIAGPFAKGIIDVEATLGLFGSREDYQQFVRQPQSKGQRPTLDEIAASLASNADSLMRAADRSSVTVTLRKDFAEEALRWSYRRTEIAAFLHRSPAAITKLLAAGKI